MANAWMVRAGEGAYVIEDFESASCVAIGWRELTDLAGIGSREKLEPIFDKAYPDCKPGRRGIWLSQVSRFLFDIKAGDKVMSYNSSTRHYLVGEITGDYKYEPNRVPDHPHVHDVKWIGKVSRDDLSVGAKNSLGAISTLFAVSEPIWNEVERVAKGEKPPDSKPSEEEELEPIKEDVLGRAHEFIKDRVKNLAWDEMQELVAGILRAMGYKTLVSGPGADMGKDIIASPDGLGLEQPRIRVEVKHRPKQQMGAPEIRSFIGALRQNDKGLYVSTGGFSKEANYEAERSTIPLTLIDLDGLVNLLSEQYEQIDTDTRALVPLKRFYWPAT